jgi:RNA polymerase primary sigma factor
MDTQPAHIIDTINRLMRTSRDLMREMGHEPTSEDLARTVGIPVEEVDRLLALARTPVRLNP